MNQNLPLSQDDPRLTAYAFNEMTPAERAEFEQLLEQDPAARQAVEEIRAAGAMLATVLEHETTAMPSSPAAAAIIPGGDLRKLDGGRAAVHDTLKQPLRFPQFYYMVSGLAAACFAAFFVYWQTNRSVHLAPKQYMKVELGNETAGKEKNAPGVAVALPAAPAPMPEPVPVVTMGSPLPAPPPETQVAADAIALSPFEAKTESDGYAVMHSAAGARVRTDLKDIGSSVTVVTNQFLRDTGSTDNSTLLRYTANTEVSGVAGNFAKKQDFNTEAYGYRQDNAFLGVRENPLSTFSIDVDTASYANVRRFLNGGQRPPPDAVRIEEMVNYFPYHYRAPAGEAPFAANLEVASAPWAPEHRLVRIGLKGREVSDAARPAANLVFLLDVSGSMDEPNKLPLVKQSLRLLVDKLRADDRVALVVYAGASGLALPSTALSHKAEILAAIDRLEADGSTNGAMGIQLAYDIAKANFITGGVNRVILATDGDFNVGVTNQGDLTRLIEEKAKGGVFLTVLGFGMGNYKDDTLELLADKGNGNYAYIDTLAEARKTLVEQAGGTLVTIAKDVKIQVEFNPAEVQAYRLIGYENRLLKKEDFTNDKVDAGEIGAGHTVTALYEVVPVGAAMPADTGTVKALKYQKTEQETGSKEQGARKGELLTVAVRYKEPAGDTSRQLDFPLRDGGARFEQASADFRFAAAVAGFGMVLRDSPYKGSVTLADITAWSREATTDDAGGYRSEFAGLVQKAQALQ